MVARAVLGHDRLQLGQDHDSGLACLAKNGRGPSRLASVKRGGARTVHVRAKRGGEDGIVGRAR